MKEPRKTKPWKQYLFEGIMITLAVMLGFFAENYREYQMEREKEQNIIESLVSCLASDTVQLQRVIERNKHTIIHLDNFCKLKNPDLTNPEIKHQFLESATHGFLIDAYFRTNDGALQQLKSSGTFQVIRKQSVVDSILQYDQLNKITIYQEGDTYHIFKEGLALYQQVVDASFLRDTTLLSYSSSGKAGMTFEFKNIDKFRINNAPEKIQQLQSTGALLAGTEDLYRSRLQKQLTYGRKLIFLLKKEYEIH